MLFILSLHTAGAGSGPAAAAARVLSAELHAEGRPAAAALEARRARALDPGTATETPAATGSRQPDTSRRGITERMIGPWIMVYRTQIGPAIGSRCLMHPSCSEYCLQAVRRHGWLGLAIYGDRAVREPDVVRKAETPVLIEGVRRYADPLCDHDHWIRRRE